MKTRSMLNPLAIAVIMTLGLSTSNSFAIDLHAIYNGRHETRIELLRLDMHRTQQVIARYLRDNLGCTQISLCMTNFTKHQDRFFRKNIPGLITLELTAVCSESFSDFRFDMSSAADWEDYTDALVRYQKDGRWVEVDLVARSPATDTRVASSIINTNNCDSSPIDPALPYKIITNPMNIRHFR